MSVINTPPIVNDQGNINVHRIEGCQIPISIQNEDGTEVDASMIPLYFICGSFKKALDIDLNNPEGRLLVLTPINLQDISHGASFSVTDETNPILPLNRWEGRIFKRG